MNLQLGPRKCETPGCGAPPCLIDYDPEAIQVAHKPRPAFVWKCDECGWSCTLPAVPRPPGRT